MLGFLPSLHLRLGGSDDVLRLGTGISQRLVVGFAPVGRAEHALQVADRRPDAPKLLAHMLHGRDEGIDVGLRVSAQQPVECGSVVGDDLPDLLDDVCHTLSTPLSLGLSRARPCVRTYRRLR